MKFIHSDDPKHTMINLEDIVNISRYDYSGQYGIKFYDHKGNGWIWYYKDAVKRDEMFDKVKIACGSQDVSLMVKFGE